MSELLKDLGVIVIGLRGRIGAGKTSLACRLLSSQKMNEDCLMGVFPFAGPLKKGLAVMGITKKDTPVLYRRWAQRVGDGLRRDPDASRDIWVKAWQAEVKEWVEDFAEGGWSASSLVVVCDDVRYPNEGEQCDVVVWIERKDRPDSSAVDNDPSEEWSVQKPGGHLILHNDGTPQGLDKMVQEVLSFMKKVRTGEPLPWHDLNPPK